MKFVDLITTTTAILKAKVFNTKTPLAISWELTNRCNLRCTYCGTWEVKSTELGTEEIIKGIESFRKIGTKWLSFTGGEALLRDDIQSLVKVAKNSGFYVSLSSNGILVEKKIEQLKLLDRLKLSLDGPRDIHDMQRGKGSFDNVMKAIIACRKNNITICFDSVLTKYNLKAVDYLIKFASDCHAKILFQPATEKLLFVDKTNPLKPPVKQYRDTILRLIEYKKKRAPIGNSMPGLKHLYCWPEPKKINCSASILMCDVLSDGSITPCVRTEKESKLETNLSKALKDMTNYPECKQCWCSSVVDFNLITSFNVRAILDYLDVF